MNKEEHYRKLEKMYASAPCNGYYVPKLTVFEGAAELVIPVREEFFHAAGAIHGSVYFKALDDAAFFAVNSLVENVFVLTVNFNIHLMRPVSGGEIRAKGKVAFASSSLFIGESFLFDSQDREVARGSGSFVKSKIKLTPDIGYS